MTKAAWRSLSLFGACGLLVAAVGLGNCGGSSSGSRTGTGGTTGKGGAGGTTGAGGAAGSGGSTGGSGGTVTALSCTPGTDPATGMLTDFNTTWNGTSGKWGTIGNLTGSIFAYMGTNAATTWNKATVTGGALSLSGSVAAGDYAGGGMAFDQCVNITTPSYTGVQFTLGGDPAGCTIIFDVQTFSQQGTTNKGGCDSTMGTCYKFPNVTVQVATDPITVHFADLANTGLPAAASDIMGQIVGFQWQLQSAAPPDGGTQQACTNAAITITNVSLVP